MLENVTNLTSLSQDCPITLDFDPRNISSFPKSAIPTWTALSIIDGITALPTIYINLLVIWTVLEKESLRSSSFNLLLAIISLTDLLVGLVLKPLYISLNVCVILRCLSTCNLTMAYTVLALLFGGWSVVTLMIISLERYIFIKHPLYHNTNVTTKKLMTATAVTWVLVAMTLVFSRFQSDNNYKIRQLPLAVVFGVSVVVIVFCFTKVSRIAYRQMKAISVQQAAVQGPNQNNIKEYKRTFALGVVLLASVLLYCPLLIVKIIALTKGKEWNADFKYTAQSYVVAFTHLQSLVNPIILSLRLSYIRAGVIKKLCWR